MTAECRLTAVSHQRQHLGKYPSHPNYSIIDRCHRAPAQPDGTGGNASWAGLGGALGAVPSWQGPRQPGPAAGPVWSERTEVPPPLGRGNEGPPGPSPLLQLRLRRAAWQRRWPRVAKAKGEGGDSLWSAACLHLDHGAVTVHGASALRGHLCDLTDLVERGTTIPTLQMVRLRLKELVPCPGSCSR